jgi:epoxyqueuosine reductase
MFSTRGETVSLVGLSAIDRSGSAERAMVGSSISSTVVDRLRTRARELGFAGLGVAPATPLERGRAALESWLGRGDHGELSYMAREPAARANPQLLLPTAQAAIVVVACYARPGADEPTPAAGAGRVARYARGEDYHRVLREGLASLAEWLDVELGPGLEHRACVDTSPLLERELAMAAGVGFIGKNTLLLTPGVGSYTVLGVLLTSARLPRDTPAEARCGSCRLCLDACPTTALGDDGYQLDARRCISNLTIERGGPLDDALDPDAELRQGTGSWVFGCDACQQVCPYNRPTRRVGAIPVDPRLDALAHPATLDLAKLLSQRSGDYRRLVRGKALSRASRPQLARNAAIAAGNQLREERGAREAVGLLVEPLEAATESPRQELSGAARWALTQSLSDDDQR